MTMTRAPVLGSLRRVDMVWSHQSRTAVREASDSRSVTEWGSSTTTRSPPSPVAAPRTETEREEPDLLLAKRCLVFWSGVSLKTSGELDWNQSDSMSRRQRTESQ